LEYLGNCLITKNYSPSSHHVSAARQVENLVCTHRESLLGSSAWKPDFLKELQSRPFYMVKRASSHCFHDCNDYGEDGEKCQACGRSSQRPDHEIALFGPSYDSKKIWDSHWINLVPKALLLHVHRLSSSSSSSSSVRTSSVTGTPVARTHQLINSSSITGVRNKQFQGYQSSSGTKPTKRKISLSPVIKHSSSSKKNAIVLSDDDDEEDPNTRLADSSINNGAKKNSILLSDSEGEEEPTGAKLVKQDVVDLSEDVLVKEEILPTVDANSSEVDDSSSVEQDDDEGSPVRSSSRYEARDETPKKYRKGVSWWEKKIVKQLNKDPESKWHLSM
jgi:hypothetical protein